MNINQINKENNVRDLGGYQAKDGRKIRKGVFFRSGGLYHLSEEEIGALKDQNLKYILDLRADYEQRRHPDPIISGTELIHHSNTVSKFGEQIDFSPEGMHQTGEAAVEQLRKLVCYYTAMPFENEALHALMNAIEQGKTPLLFHCATGKDRTGVAAMVLLMALGIPEETILQDYLKSNEYRKNMIEAAEQEFHDQIEKSPELGTLIQMQAGVRKEIGQAVLDAIKEKYGSYSNYLIEEYGLDRSRLKRIQDMYLV